jgi:hypothetical protein
MCVIVKPRRNEEAQAHIGLSSHRDGKREKERNKKKKKKKKREREREVILFKFHWHLFP